MSPGEERAVWRLFGLLACALAAGDEFQETDQHRRFQRLARRLASRTDARWRLRELRGRAERADAFLSSVLWHLRKPPSPKRRAAACREVEIARRLLAGREP